MGPTEDTPIDKRPKSWNKDVYCKFYRGNGHDIEDCFKLKNLSQNMVDNNSTTSSWGKEISRSLSYI